MKYAKNVSHFAKFLAQKSRNRYAEIMCKITELEKDIDSDKKFEEYDKTRNELEQIYDKIGCQN